MGTGGWLKGRILPPPGIGIRARARLQDATAQAEVFDVIGDSLIPAAIVATLFDICHRITQLIDCREMVY